MTTSVKANFLPPSLISNLQQVLATRNDAPEQRSHNAGANSVKTPSSPLSEGQNDGDGDKPVVLVTNADGIDSPGLAFLVEALRLDSRVHVCVCAPRVLVPEPPSPSVWTVWLSRKNFERRNFIYFFAGINRSPATPWRFSRQSRRVPLKSAAPLLMKFLVMILSLNLITKLELSPDYKIKILIFFPLFPIFIISQELLWIAYL